MWVNPTYKWCKSGKKSFTDAFADVSLIQNTMSRFSDSDSDSGFNRSDFSSENRTNKSGPIHSPTGAEMHVTLSKAKLACLKCAPGNT